MADKLPIQTVLAALDNKNYDFYDSLSEEDQKKVPLFILNRYMSSVKGSADLHAYYLMATNQRVNESYFDIAKHPGLVWQLLCTVSPGMGTHFHKWISSKKKTSDNKPVKILEKLYPLYKDDEIALLASITTKKELKTLLEQHGLTEKDL